MKKRTWVNLFPGWLVLVWSRRAEKVSRSDLKRLWVFSLPVAFPGNRQGTSVSNESFFLTKCTGFVWDISSGTFCLGRDIAWGLARCWLAGVEQKNKYIFLLNKNKRCWAENKCTDGESGVGRTHLANAVKRVKSCPFQSRSVSQAAKEGEWDCFAACVMHLPLPDVFCLSALPPPGLHSTQISIGQVFALWWT